MITSNKIQIAMWLDDPDVVAKMQSVKSKKDYITQLIKRDVAGSTNQFTVFEKNENDYKVLSMFDNIDDARKYVLQVATKRATGQLFITTESAYKQIKGGKIVC